MATKKKPTQKEIKKRINDIKNHHNNGEKLEDNDSKYLIDLYKKSRYCEQNCTNSVRFQVGDSGNNDSRCIQMVIEENGENRISNIGWRIFANVSYPTIVNAEMRNQIQDQIDAFKKKTPKPSDGNCYEVDHEKSFATIAEGFFHENISGYVSNKVTENDWKQFYENQKKDKWEKWKKFHLEQTKGKLRWLPKKDNRKQGTQVKKIKRLEKK
jgi:hypothetical protein